MGSRVDERLAEHHAAHASSAARLAYLLTRDQHIVDDIVQEAFVRVGGRIMTLRDPSSAAGYLFRTITNLAKGHGRHIVRQRNLERRIGRLEPSTQPDLGDRDQLWKALMTLPLRQRSAIFLRYYLDLSEVEAAQALDCSTGAMKSLTHRALRSLQKQLQGAQS